MKRKLLLVVFVLVGAVLAWKRPEIGGWTFILLGVLIYLNMIFRQQWWSGLIIGGVPLLAGILFLLEGFKKVK
jgi:hypothetical protein